VVACLEPFYQNYSKAALIAVNKASSYISFTKSVIKKRYHMTDIFFRSGVIRTCYVV
jgi:hypothetical protein